jgi:hypothetical protein
MHWPASRCARPNEQLTPGPSGRNLWTLTRRLRLERARRARTRVARIDGPRGRYSQHGMADETPQPPSPRFPLETWSIEAPHDFDFMNRMAVGTYGAGSESAPRQARIDRHPDAPITPDA